MYSLTFWLCLCISVSESARILGIFPFPSFSHQSVFQAIYRELSLSGHEVVVITPNPLNDSKLINLTEIDLSSSYDILRKNSLQKILYRHESIVTIKHDMLSLLNEIANYYLSYPEVQKLLSNDTEKFDLVLVEAFQQVFHTFGFKYKAPVIGILSFATTYYINEMIGNPDHPIINPDLILTYNGKLDFWSRWYSVFINIYTSILQYYDFYETQNALAKKYFGDDIPELKYLLKNMSMLFVATSLATQSARSHLPSVVELGLGIHIKPKNPLPEDLQEVLDKAKEGVVYFSMGSTMKSTLLHPNIINTTIQAVSELPYKVLFKWELDEMPNKPKNVIIRKWMPQQDILRHPNIKVFVTQGGIQSIEEAIYNKIPVVVLPLAFDQSRNALIVVDKGYGISLQPETLSKNQLKAAIIEVVENIKYRNKVEEIRNTVLDEPMTALEKAVWWSEYVIRNKGAKHFRSPVLDLPFYQYYLIDVIGTTLLLAAFILYLFYTFLLICIKRFRKIKHEKTH